MNNAVFFVWGMERFGRMYSRILGWPYFQDRPVGDVDTVYIVGMYDSPDYDWTNDNTKRAKRRIIHWCGSDAMELRRPEMLPEATHLADSQQVRDRLLKVGIDAPVVMCPTALHPPLTPLPDKPIVSVYFGGVAENYGASYVRFLMDAMPDVQFATYQYGQFDDEQMLKLIERTTVYLRLTSHDGSASGAREFLEGGRYVVTSQPIPHAKQVSLESPVDILRAVRSALKNTEPNVAAHEHYKEFNSERRYLAQLKEATDATRA